MDTGNGTLKQLVTEDQQSLADAMKAMEQAYPQHGGWFREGEIIEIRGSRFRIQSVKPTGLRLRLLGKGVLNER